MMRVRRTAPALVLAAMLAAGTSAVAQEDTGAPVDLPAERTYNVRSGGHASALYLEVSRPLTLPFDPILPLTAAAADGGIDEDIAETVAFASALYPGDLLANAGGLIGLVGFPVGGTVLPGDHPISQLYASLPGLIPPWPFEARASHPDSPGERVDLLSELSRSVVPLPVPVTVTGLVQDANAAEGFAASSAVVGGLEVANPLPAIPGVSQVVALLRPLLAPLVGEQDPLGGNLLTLEGLRSTFNTTITPDGAEVTAQTQVGSVDLFGGLLEIGDMTATVVMRGDGGAVEVVEQGYDLGAVSVLGVGVALTDGGVRVTDQRIPVGSLGVIEDLLNQLLDSVQEGGVHIELPKLTEAGSSRGVQLLELQLRGANPAVPFVLPAGDAKVTIRIGEVAARLETFSLPPTPTSSGVAPTDSSGDTDGVTPSVAPSRSSAQPPASSSAGAGELAAGSSPTAPGSSTTPSARVPLTAAELAAIELSDLTRRLLVVLGVAAVAGAFGWRRRVGSVA